MGILQGQDWSRSKEADRGSDERCRTMDVDLGAPCCGERWADVARDRKRQLGRRDSRGSCANSGSGRVLRRQHFDGRRGDKIGQPRGGNEVGAADQKVVSEVGCGRRWRRWYAAKTWR